MRIYIVLLGLMIAASSMAQDKVMHDGRMCYLHLVEQGNTLYGISREYAIPVEKLTEANPESKAGLNIGQRIYIPLESVNRKEAKKSPEHDGNLLIHKVAKGETLYSLAKKYDIPINAILEANPGLEGQGLKKGSEVRIPTIAVRAETALVRPAEEDSLIHHTVLQGETLYGISKDFAVDIDAISVVNNGLPEGLRSGMTLRIPKRRDGNSMLKEEPVSEPVDTLLSEAYDLSRELRLGLLLPFSLDESELVIPRKRENMMRMTDIAYEFYHGVQLALSELSDEGLNAAVTVVDVSSKEEDIKACLGHGGIEELDIVLGPLHGKAFEKISADGRLNQVFRASPLSRSLGKVSTADENVSKLKPDVDVLIRATVDEIWRAHSGARVVMISGEKKSYHKQIQEAWTGLDSTMHKDSIPTLKTLAWSSSIREKLIDALDPDGPNVIIYPVEDAPSATAFMAEIATTDFREHDITLFGMESWLGYDNLDVDVLERLKLTLVSSKFIDWEDKRTVDFLKRFEDEFSTVPSPSGYAFVAYDMTNFYLRGMMDHGSDFLDHQDYTKYIGLCQEFDMQRSAAGSWVNRSAQVLHFEEFEFKPKY